MISALSSSLSGLQSATQRINVAAENIATGSNAGLASQGINDSQTKRTPQSGSPVRAGFNPVPDLASNLVDLKLAEISYKASARALKVALETGRNLIDQVR